MNYPETSGNAERGVHQGQPVATAGAPLTRARAAMIVLHGRGATARSILTLADELAQPDVAYLAPQAAGQTWYPFSFLAPLAQNEPALSSALQTVADVLAHLEAAGFPAERVVLSGFSQGACLSLEYAARHPRRYGGLVALSGGLIGTGPRADAEPPHDKLFAYAGDLENTPVFLGCSDQDPHIPLARVRESARILKHLGGAVDERIYPGMGHTVNEDEIRAVRGVLARLLHPA